LKAQTVDPDDSQAVANTIVRHTTTTLGRQAFNMDDVSSFFLSTSSTCLWKVAAYQATALSVRDQLISRWNETTA
jgi:starch phosphorylase